MNKPLCYAGIGSRSTPNIVGVEMGQWAKNLEDMGFVLRSGGAEGADTFFKEGTTKDTMREIYVAGYAKQGDVAFDTLPLDIRKEALYLASQHHPAWSRLSPYVQKLMARNILQVLGKDLDNPSKFVLFWAKPKKDSFGNIYDAEGGTGLAVRFAYASGIPVYHVEDPESALIKTAVFNKDMEALRHIYQNAHEKSAGPSGVKL